MGELALKRHSLSLFFVIAYAIPIVVAIVVALTAGRPSDIVVKDVSAAAVIVIMAMVHAPMIAAIIVVFRSQGLSGVGTLFRQLTYWTFPPAWYLRAILIFPATIFAVLLALSLYSANFTPVLSLSIMAFSGLLSSLWEEIGWTGVATPLMLKRLSPLNVGLQLGFLHALWHLAASIYGAGEFHGNLFVVNFVATAVGIVGLRIITIWIYAQTRSLVLGWLTHASFTSGQLSLVTFELTPPETVIWNWSFSLAVIALVVFVVLRNREWMTLPGER